MVGSKRQQLGFSMIEVLVTLLVISLALLGTAGLQAYSMRLNQGSQFRTQAVFLAADLAERIEANRPAAIAGSYATSWDYTTSGAYDWKTKSSACSTGECSSEALMAFDISQWQSAVASTLPQVSWVVCVDADSDGVCDAAPVPSDPITYTITVSWVDRKSDVAAADFVAGGNTQQSLESTGASNAAGSGERFFYKATRTVSTVANN